MFSTVLARLADRAVLPVSGPQVERQILGSATRDLVSSDVGG
jgi:hypothetical protein